MKSLARSSVAVLFLLAASAPSVAADVPVFEDTSTLPSGDVTVGTGKAKTVAVQTGRDALLRFDLASLPASYDAVTLQSARLRIYVTKVGKAGDLSVHNVLDAWSETADGPAPALDAAPLASIAAASYRSRGFVVVDVTETARAWLADPATNNGVAVIVADDTGTKVSFAAKEGPGGGPAAELEMEAAFAAGTGNTNPNGSSVISGGVDNLIAPDADFSVIPGGSANEIGPDADFSFAAGRRATVNHDGSFVWADSTNADFTSTAPNQFRIRAASGLSIANDGGAFSAWPVGTYFRDNAIFSWGRITAAGGLDASFNVASVTRVSTGVYTVSLNPGLGSGFSLIAMVQPEVDNISNPPPVPPTGAAAARFAVVDKFAAGDTFNVYMYNGSFALVDNDFDFLVTGR